MTKPDPTEPPADIAEYIQQCQEVIDELEAAGHTVGPETQARLDRMFGEPTQPQTRQQKEKPMKFDRAVYIIHHPDQDPLDAPMTRRYTTAEDAYTKAFRTKNKRTVSKVIIERPE